MGEELKDTFDGYLMFDFSNFKGLMAQTFDNEEIDIPKVEKLPKRKINNIPGPYLDSPAIDLERSGDNSEGILFNADLGDDDIPEVNLDDDCLSNFNYSTSGFNLLANLDFEPDEDAYDNAINITEELSSANYPRTSKTSRTKKISIFSPTLQFDDNVDQKIQMITLQNMELLKKEDHYDIDDFYKFLTSLDFLNVSNQKQNDDQIQVDQLVHLVQIRQYFDKMNDLLHQKTEQSHSISYTSKLHYFQLRMDHFNNLVNYMVDNGTNRQKSLRDQQSMKKDHTLTMSVAFFKGVEIISQFQSLLTQKNMIDRLKKFSQYKKQFRSFARLIEIIKKWKINIILKSINRNSSNLTQSTSNLQTINLDFQNIDDLVKIYMARNRESNRVYLTGWEQRFKIKRCEQKEINGRIYYEGKWQKNQNIYQNYQDFKIFED